MTDAPERIWLQDDNDYEGARNSMAGTDTGVTWCDTPINDNDSEYIRADLVPRWSSDMDAWNKVSEVLPTRGQTVIAWAADGENQIKNLMLETCFNGRDFVYGYHNNWMRGVTHWMPLPAPPKEGE